MITNATLEQVWDRSIKDLDLKDLPAIDNDYGSCDALIINDEKAKALKQSKMVEEKIKENQDKGYLTMYTENGKIIQCYPDGSCHSFFTPLDFYKLRLENIDFRMNIEQGNSILCGYNRTRRVKTQNNVVSKAFNRNLKVMIVELSPELFS